MNYFELYGIAPALRVDPSLIKQKFYELSRKYHPDFYANAPAEEQAEMLERSSLVNKAYKTFSDPDDTIKYVLQLKGLLEEEEKYQLPPDFLMEMMELNEQLTEAVANEAQLKNIRSSISDLQKNIYEPVKKIVEHYQEGITTEKELLQVKDYYYRKKYLNRILAGMG